MRKVHRARAIAWGLAAVLASGAASCLPAAVFECELDDECADLGEGARCQTSVGFCSAPDDTCDSAQRFHEYAGDGLAGLCTEPRCGDGVVSEGEACDDGNEVDGDGCNRDCQVSGQEVWTAEFASPGNVRDRCYAVAVDPAGNVAAIGHVTVEGEGQNLWVRQYSPDGEPMWTWVLNGDGNADEEGWSIVPDPAGGFLVGGYVATADQESNAWIGKLNADGILEWDAQWDGGESYLDQTRGVTFAPDGDVVAIGYATTDRQAETDLWFQRRSPDGQMVRWTQHRDGYGPNNQDRAHGVARVAGGYVGVGMKATDEPAQYFWIEHFDEQGQTIWSDEGIGGPKSAWTSVAVTPEGDVLLAGWKASAAGDTDMWLQRRGLGGEVQWDEIVASPGGDDDKANVILSDGTGGFIVGGEMGAGAGSTDAWIRRYAPDRTEVWTISYSGPAGDRDTTWGLTLDAAGNVYACGYQSSPGTEWDLWVRKFTP